MTVGDPADPGSVLNPTNYLLTGDQLGVVLVRSVRYDPAARTATLSFDSLQPDRYALAVKTSVQSAEGLGLAEEFVARFEALSDFSPYVRITFTNGRGNLAAQTYSYTLTVTNLTGYNLLAPLYLYVDGL